MAKETTKGATAKVVALSPEEFQKLTPEEQLAYVQKVTDANASLQSANEELASKVKEATKEVLPTFDVEADEKNDIEGGTYQFTCPTFHWDDNTIIPVRELVETAKYNEDGKIENPDTKLVKAAEAAQAILGHLVARKSGIITRKED